MTNIFLNHRQGYLVVMNISNIDVVDIGIDQAMCFGAWVICDAYELDNIFDATDRLENFDFPLDFGYSYYVVN